MSVRKRALPSGKTAWQCDYRDQQGKRRARQFRTQTEAKDFETVTRGEIRTGVHTPDSTSITVREAGELWLNECSKLERGTQRYYQQHVRDYIVPRIGGVRLSRLTRGMIEGFKDRLVKERSEKIAARILTSLKGILGNAQRLELVAQNVAAGVKVKKSARHEKRVKIPTKDEIRALLAATGEVWPMTSPWRPFIVTALFTGMRPSELRGLTWEHIDFDMKLIRVRQRADYRGVMGSPKSKAGNRDIPASSMTLNALRQWRLCCPKSEAGLVFPTKRGGVLLSSEMWFAWNDLLAAIGLPAKSYRLYDLRHAAASLMIEQGMSPKKLQTIMGHSSIQMTFDVYGHLFATPESDQEAMAQIEARLLRSL